MFQEGVKQPALRTHTSETVTYPVNHLPKVFHAAIGKLLALDVCPQPFNRIDIRGIGGKPYNAQAVFLLLQILRHPLTTMRGQPVPEKDTLYHAGLLQELLQEAD